MTRTNENPNPKRSLSQKKRILSYLQAGGNLTPLDALMKVGTMKLATRISELINEDGHTEIRKTPTIVETADGGTARVMCYYIEPPQLELGL